MGLYDDEINAEREAELDRAKRTIARLQEQVETLRKERDANHHMAVANGQRAKDEHYRAEAAEAERDRLREAQNRVTDLLESYETRFAPRHTIPEREIGILDTCQNIRMALAGTHDPAALQKEPQP